MPAAATRAVPLPRPQTLPPLPTLTRLLAFVKLLSDTMQEAKADAREAARRYPFVDW